MTMDTPHDAPAHHGGLIFIEPAATAPASPRAALLRPRVATGRPAAPPRRHGPPPLRPRVATGRPAAPPRRHGPPPLRAPGPGETPGPLDPADPGLDDRVRAILDRPRDARADDAGGPAV